jgi:hypothetical protein
MVPPRSRRNICVCCAPQNEETFAAAWAEGQALSFDAAFAPGLTAPDATSDAGTRAP